ncbi:MAG: TlpA family protein disulfide reductase [Gemmatimonadaceae bacterium]|nr:TlpA family protein disulfide reductase [Gemmatimonadaceae bacterium]
MRHRGVRILRLLLLTGLVACTGTPSVGVGARAPDFRAAVVGAPVSETRTIADYEGEVVLINLWATWCVPCVTEMPSIQRLYDRYRDQGLRVVGIAVDDPPYGERVASWVKEHGITFEILHEGSGKVELDYRARGIPATYIIGRDGRIRVIRQGAADWDSPASRDVISQLLRPDTP